MRTGGNFRQLGRAIKVGVSPVDCRKLSLEHREGRREALATHARVSHPVYVT